MTPAETLQAAAERLTALDKAAPGGTWERDTDFINTDIHRDVEVGTTITDPALSNSTALWWPLLQMMDGSLEEREAGADLIVALRPVAPLLAEILADMAGTAAKDPRLFEETASGKRWLAVARTILGGAE